MTYKVLITDEAIDDMAEQALYIRDKLCNPEAADKLLAGLEQEFGRLSRFPLKGSDSGITYRSYIIHKKVYQSYLLFYILDDKSNMIIILRVLKNIMNWPGMLRESKIYHFSSHKNKYSDK